MQCFSMNPIDYFLNSVNYAMMTRELVCMRCMYVSTDHVETASKLFGY
jgi:hypothetical protein